MPDILRKFIDDARNRIRTGYYDIENDLKHRPTSLRRALKSAQNNAIIAEIKPVSPALGPLRLEIDVVEAAVEFRKGGAVAISVLTEPENFGGSLENLRRIRARVDLPLLMKDIVVDETQVLAGRKCGADCILLIESIFSKYNAGSLQNLISVAHQNQLEVLLEVHNEDELRRAIGTDANIIGVNNRDLMTMEVDLKTTIRLLASITERHGKMVISESGFEKADDLGRIKPLSVDGFLIGSSIMLSSDLAGKVREFVLA